MFDTIVWATDGSETADAALSYARELAERTHARLVVAHVREVFVGRAGGYPILADENELAVRIEEQVHDLQDAGIDAELVMRSCNSGHVPRTLAAIAKSVEADLIVLGTQGHSRVGEFLLGSTTQGLLHAGVCPVLAVAPVAARVA